MKKTELQKAFELVAAMRGHREEQIRARQRYGARMAKAVRQDELIALGDEIKRLQVENDGLREGLSCAQAGLKISVDALLRPNRALENALAMDPAYSADHARRVAAHLRRNQGRS